jgi:hypothetical protein
LLLIRPPPQKKLVHHVTGSLYQPIPISLTLSSLGPTILLSPSVSSIFSDCTFVLDRLYCCCDLIPEKNNLRERCILFTVSGQQALGSRAAHIMEARKQRERIQRWDKAGYIPQGHGPVTYFLPRGPTFCFLPPLPNAIMSGIHQGINSLILSEP